MRANRIKRRRKYIFNFLISIDQLANTLLGGDPDETISSRCAKRQHIWYWKYLGLFLEFVDPGHLEWALEEDEGDQAL